MKTRKSRPAKPSRRLRPQVEVLEDRTVPVVVEGFDAGNLTAWTTVLRNTPSANTTLTAAAAHDGDTGLAKTDGYEWLVRNDAPVQVGQGQTFSVWIRFADQADGRAYFAFGATPNLRGGSTGTGGALSLVLAANTNELQFQANSQLAGETFGAGTAYFKGFANPVNAADPRLLATVPQTYQANRWYKAEVTWAAGGALTGRLYDSDGTTVLNTVTANSSSARLAGGIGQTSGQLNPLVAGGIGLRSFGSVKHFDTFEVTGTATTTSPNVGRTLIPAFLTTNTPRIQGSLGVLPSQYTARPGTQLDVQLINYDSLQQVAIVGSQVGLTMRNISFVGGILNLDMQQGWGPIVSGLTRPETGVETSVLQHYLFRQRPGEPTQLIGSSDGKHFFDSARADFQHLRPGQPDTYETFHNSNRNFYTPATDIDPVTGQVPNKDHFGNFGGQEPRSPDGVPLFRQRTFGSAIEHLLQVNVGDLDPALNPPGTNFYLMGNLWVVGDQDVSNNSRWVRVQPSFNGTTFTFSSPDGALGQFDFRTIPGLPLEAAPVVTGLLKTPNGLVINFSQPIDPSTLNLYDGPGGTNAPDLVVNGPNGPVRGSLVVDPNGRRVTFIKSGGLLDEGTYTITIRSDATGFKNTSGAPLDGDGDGAAGGHYTGTFVVDHVPTGVNIPVTISIPDFVRGPGQDVDVPATSTDNDLPVRFSVNAGNTVTAVGFTLNFNPNLLTISNVLFAAGINGTFTQPSPGVLNVTATFDTPQVGPIDGNVFARLVASVPASAANSYKAKAVLDLVARWSNTAAPPNLVALDDDGLQSVLYFGDTSGNGSLNSTDATRALQLAVGQGSGFAGLLLTDPVLIADITGNGIVNSLDATRILQEAVGIDQPEIPPPPTEPVVIPPGGIDPLLNIPRRFRGRPGGLITVPVRLDFSEGLQNGDLAISFDNLRLEVVSVARGSLTRDFDLFTTNFDNEAGSLQAVFHRSAGPVNGRGAGSVLRVTFRVRPDAPAGEAVINLRQNWGATVTQLNDGAYDLVPDPSNEAGDSLDGLIRVLAGRRVAPVKNLVGGQTDPFRLGGLDLVSLVGRRKRGG